MRRPVHITAEQRSEPKGKFPFTAVTLRYKTAVAVFYFRGNGHARQAAGFVELCAREHAGGSAAIRAIYAAAKSHRNDGGYAALTLCGELAEADA